MLESWCFLLQVCSPFSVFPFDESWGRETYKGEAGGIYTSRSVNAKEGSLFLFGVFTTHIYPQYDIFIFKRFHPIPNYTKSFVFLFEFTLVYSKLCKHLLRRCGKMCGPQIHEETLCRLYIICIIIIMGVSVNGGTPKTPPKWSFLVGKPVVVGHHHFRKPPYM